MFIIDRLIYLYINLTYRQKSGCTICGILVAQQQYNQTEINSVILCHKGLLLINLSRGSALLNR